jgi:hypothetical protein
LLEVVAKLLVFLRFTFRRVQSDFKFEFVFAFLEKLVLLVLECLVNALLLGLHVLHDLVGLLKLDLQRVDLLLQFVLVGARRLLFALRLTVRVIDFNLGTQRFDLVRFLNQLLLQTLHLHQEFV